jgi:hypothetical protein
MIPVSILREAVNRSTGDIFYGVLDPGSLSEYDIYEFKLTVILYLPTVARCAVFLHSQTFSSCQ